MSGDADNRKDEELLNQIDELKARMDRLMAGGTSTSNSALLTDAPHASSSVVEAKPVPEAPPPRTRVGDLLGSTAEQNRPDPDALRRAAVTLSGESDGAEDTRPADRPDERRDERRDDRPASTPPPSKPPAADGSLIAVNGQRAEPRPRVASFDDLGSAVEQELARDSSVPPVPARKGPGLASRFGPSDEPVDKPQREEEKPPEPVDEDDASQEVEEVAELEEFEALDDRRGRRGVGAVVAIWIVTAIASGGIAVLHFAGII